MQLIYEADYTQVFTEFMSRSKIGLQLEALRLSCLEMFLCFRLYLAKNFMYHLNFHYHANCLSMYYNLNDSEYMKIIYVNYG